MKTSLKSLLGQSPLTIALPEFPEKFDLMECLYQGVRVQVDKKTGEIMVRVDRPTSESSLSKPLEPSERDEGQEANDGA